MNVHHLELFYYVAKHRGVSAAARHIPYGIQQPAISAQIIQLEGSLGVTLFHRRPFDLTQAGRDLYQFIEPFFKGLPQIEDKLRGGREVRVRIGAPEAIQQHYLPPLLRGLKKRFPSLEFTLTGGRQDELEQLLLDQDIDIAFTAVHSRIQPGIRQQELVKLTMALLVTEGCGLKRAEQLWRMDRIEVPLITVPSYDPLCMHFQQELQRRKIEWFPALELNSLDLVHRYAADGFGFGLVPVQKDRALPKGTRLVPLDDFPQVPYAALWIGKPSSLLEIVLEEVQRIAAQLR
jgi:DNA-binding transcriptional LysR family regulator